MYAGEENPDCETDYDRIYHILETTTVRSKIITKYFNPAHYMEHGNLEYKEAQTFMTQLYESSDFGSAQQIELNMHKIDYWGSKWLQLSNFPMFFQPEELEIIEPNWKQTSLLYGSEEQANLFGPY